MQTHDCAVDALDRAIIDQLAHHGRLTNAELAERVGLTPSPCLRRVKRLEDAGIITGYYARIDPVAAGRAYEVIVHADLATNHRQAVERFESAIETFDEVVECRRMFGQPDYIIRVAVPDHDAFERFLTTRLLDLPAISRVNSHFTMKTVKSED